MIEPIRIERRVPFVLVVFLLVALSACAPQNAPMANDKAVDAIMQAYAGDVPGASVLVVRDGKPLVRKAYGLANLEEKTAATPATNYRLASVTKQMTAAAIMTLVRDGRSGLRLRPDF